MRTLKVSHRRIPHTEEVSVMESAGGAEARVDGLEATRRFMTSSPARQAKQQRTEATIPSDGSPAVAQRLSFNGYPPRSSVPQAALRTAPPPVSGRTGSAGEAKKSVTMTKASSPGSAPGFLLLDSSLRPISFNAEAIQVLSYPDKLANVRRPDVLLAGKIRSSLISEPSSRESPLVTEFRSGRRRYLCRAFFVDSPAKGPSHASIAVLLERASSGLISLSQVSQQFNLTRREREVLAHLLQGLSGKEIANRMNISPSTVKVFVRLIMVKMGVSSRSGIVAKIITTKS